MEVPATMSTEKTLQSVIEDVSKTHGVSPDLLTKMLDIERNKLHLERRRGVVDELHLILAKELGDKRNR